MDVFSPQLDTKVKRLTQFFFHAARHNSGMNDIYSIRRRNFEAQLRQPPLSAMPRKKDWAIALNLSASMLSQVLNPEYRIGNDLARDIERQLNLRPGTMDMSGPSQSARMDRPRLRDAITVLTELGELQGVPELQHDQQAIAIAYDFLMEFDTPMEQSSVLDFTKRLAAKLREERGDGGRESKAG